MPFDGTTASPAGKVYPYRLAEAVINSFCKKLGRAPAFVAEKLGCSLFAYKMRLRSVFMYDNRRWNSIRDAIKAVEKGKYYEVGKRIPPRLLQKCLTDVKYYQILLVK